MNTPAPTPASHAIPPLRIRREWEWVHVPGREVRYGGGPPPMQLKSVDVLEMRIGEEWVAVPVEAAPTPESPQEAYRKSRQGKMPWT